MVDYSLVRPDCPLISFFFARLCSLLEVIGRKRPRVGLFVEKTCPYRSVLLLLFPLVYCLLGIAQSLIMFGKGGVRSSELEMVLSLSEDRGALEVTFPSSLHKAWSISCALKGKD